MTSQSFFFMDRVTGPERTLCGGACPLVDVHGISPLPMGYTVPISYDDSSTRMIAIFFGFMCFFLLSAFIVFLWWPIRDTKIQGDGDTDVESLPSDWSFGDGDYLLKLPRAWIETMKRCPDDQFDARLHQLQKETLENSFESDVWRQQEHWQSGSHFASAHAAATSGDQWSETVSIQLSAEQPASYGLATGGKLIVVGGGRGADCSAAAAGKVFGRTRKCNLCSHGWENSEVIRQAKLDEFEEVRSEIKKENFLKIYEAYHQYLLMRYDHSKA